MSRTLITTKLFKPTLRRELVPRPHLVAALNAGLSGKLTLVSAPAGYGKTTLLGEWIDQQEVPFGWVSLDAKDNDPDRFFSYLIAGLQAIDVTVEDNILSNLQTQSGDKVGAFLLPLINQISASADHFALVLDDYHRIHDQEIHNALTYLLENLPPNMHLVIATRSDPPLRLAKLRAQGELCEVRVDDLRFTVEEAVQYFNQSMGLGMSPSDITILTQKTEGWIVGLQLAGITLQKHPDKHQFVVTFAGDDRYIADYLLDEALNRQPAQIQSFLLQTSILDRLCASLCDSVTGWDDSQSLLTALEQANLFLVPLDHQRVWYRYHHMFADLLQNRLKLSKSAQLRDLHRKASIWYEDNSLLADAINHAVAADEMGRIVQLTENLAIHKMDAGELDVLIAWLDRQPNSLLLRHPWLLVARSWVFLNTGKYDAVETSLTELEDILSAESYSKGLVSSIQGHIAAIRSYLAEMRSDPNTAIQLAEDALKFLPEKNVQLRAFVATRLANALSWMGDLERAIDALREAGDAAKAAEDGQLALTAHSEMATLQFVTGQLSEAIESFEEIKSYAEFLAQKDGRRLPAMGMIFRQLGSALLERNRLSEAKYYASEAVQICQQWGEKDTLMHALLVLAKVNFFHGEFDKYEHYIDQAIQVSKSISILSHSFVIAFRYHYLLVRGELEEVEIWSRDSALSIDDEIRFDQRIDYQNFARLLAAKGNYEHALQIIKKLVILAENAGAKFYTIKLYVLLAKILQQMNQPEDAIQALEKALAIASPEGYVRSFLDEGELIAQLVYQAAQEGIYPEYCQRLLDEFSKEVSVPRDSQGRPGDLVEPLTERELEVLGLIAQGSTNQEIARDLYLSLYTVKSHARNIFSKLGVKNRTEAVAKARLFGLLDQI